MGNTASAQKILEDDLQNFSKKLPVLAKSLEDELEQQGITSPIFEKIRKVIDKRAKHVLNYFS